MDDPHLSNDLSPDSDGWYWARCTCGFEMGPLPDSETMTDVLMEHAAEMERAVWI